MKIQRGKWTFEFTEDDWRGLFVLALIIGIYTTLSISACH